LLKIQAPSPKEESNNGQYIGFLESDNTTGNQFCEKKKEKKILFGRAEGLCSSFRFKKLKSMNNSIINARRKPRKYT